MSFVAPLHDCVDLIDFCITLHNCLNARVQSEVTCTYSCVWFQGVTVIFKAKSINCFVLDRDLAPMLQIRSTTYQNVPQLSNFTFRFFISSSSMFKMQQFATLLCTSRQILILTMLGPSKGDRSNGECFCPPTLFCFTQSAHRDPLYLLID